MVLRLSLAILLAAQSCPRALAQTMDENHLKASFLCNFARFIEWPPEAFRRIGDPFTICVLGHDPFDRALEDLVAGKAIGGRPFAVRHISGPPQIAGCQILFFSPSSRTQDLPADEAAIQTGFLTVGEAPKASADEMVITLNLQDGRIRFEVNLRKANAEKLHVSARLLSLATVVRK